MAAGGARGATRPKLASVCDVGWGFAACGHENGWAEGTSDCGSSSYRSSSTILLLMGRMNRRRKAVAAATASPRRFAHLHRQRRSRRSPLNHGIGIWTSLIIEPRYKEGV